MTKYREAGGKDPSLSWVDSLLIERCQTGCAKVLYPVAHHNLNFFWHCLHRWERHSWECRQRHETISHGTIRFFLSVALRIRSLFKRFLHCGSKAFGVVQSTKCFVVKWETTWRSVSPALSEDFCSSIKTLSTPSFASLYMLPFSQTYLFRVFQRVKKTSKGFNKMKLFHKDRFKHDLNSLDS